MSFISQYSLSLIVKNLKDFECCSDNESSEQKYNNFKLNIK